MLRVRGCVVSDLDKLRAIERYDPDGGDREPTDADYLAHETWARQAFGDDVWNTYRQGGWDEARYADLM